MKPFIYAMLLGVLATPLASPMLVLADEMASPLAQDTQTEKSKALLEADVLTEEASQLMLQRKHNDVFPLLEKALKIRQRWLPKDHVDIQISLVNLAGNYRIRGDYERAEESLKKALQVLRQPGQDERVLAIALHQSGIMRSHQKQYGEAESFFKEAIAINKASEPPMLSEHYGRLARVYQAQQRYAEAISFFQQANELMEQRSKTDSRLAKNYSYMGYGYGQLQDFEQSEVAYLRALELNQLIHGQGSFPASASALDLAVTYMERARYEEAEALFLQAIPVQREYLGEGHSSLAMNYIILADVYMGLGELEKVKSLYAAALGIFKTNLGDDHSNTQRLIGLIAELPSDLQMISLKELGL